MPRSGVLEVYHGPMCSDKTHHLCSKLSSFADTNTPTCYINNKKDNRAGDDSTFSTNRNVGKVSNIMSIKINKYKVAKLKDFKDIDQYQVIGIDEAQLFDDLIETVELWLNLNKIIIVAGLNANYKMGKYGKVLDLIPMSTYSEHLRAICEICRIDGYLGVPAPHTLRLIDDDQETIIGGCDIYIPTCRYHHDLLSNMSQEKRYELLNNGRSN